MSTPLVPLGRRPEAAAPVPRAAATTGLVYVETYGCQMNVADSDLIGGILRDAGYAATTDASLADVVLINTCAVREKAEERVVAREQRAVRGNRTASIAEGTGTSPF